MPEQPNEIAPLATVTCTTVDVAPVPVFTTYTGLIIDPDNSVVTIPSHNNFVLSNSVNTVNNGSVEYVNGNVGNENIIQTIGALATGGVKELTIVELDSGNKIIKYICQPEIGLHTGDPRVVQIRFETADGNVSVCNINKSLLDLSSDDFNRLLFKFCQEIYDNEVSNVNKISGLYSYIPACEEDLSSECSALSKLEDVDEDMFDMAETPDPVAVLCQYCNFASPDPDVCQRCRRRLVADTPSDDSVPNKDGLKEPSESEISPTKTEHERSSHKRRRCSRKSRKQEIKEHREDDILVLSSDEESKDEKKIENGELPYPKALTDVFSKEPVITPDTETPHDSMRGGGLEVETLLDNADIERIKLDCRTVRFGSYKVVPTDKIVLTEHGLKMKVPCLSKNNTSVIKILMKDIVKVLIHFGQSAQVSSGSAPAMFYYITHEASKRIRDALHMTNMNQDFYFDSTSKEELHKRITLLPETVSQNDRLFIKSIYESRCLMEELSWDEANDILVRAAPKEVQHNLKKDAPNVKNLPSTSSTNNDIQVIMIYPPPPVPGGFQINTEDYGCLKEDQFLNDVIIDFYLKYLSLNILSEEDKKRTHIYSSFFYKRLTTYARGEHNMPDYDLMTPAEKRHARVKKWTKSIDIFEKDFLIIPINERSHWFLGIICFPGLTGPVRMLDGTPVATEGKKKESSVLDGGQVPAKIWGTTISIVRTGSEKSSSSSRGATISLLEGEDERGGDESDRDEAEADEDDMEPNTTDEESAKDEELLDEATPRVNKTKPNMEPIKQPCILIFDSLACASRSKVCATLREYLQVEWKVKNKGKERDFSKNVFKGAVPKVPQQNNFIDCGVYLLQYVEAFFKYPITDYRMPIRSIKEWFTPEEVNRKRYDIMQLLLNLMREQNVDIARLNLPHLDLSPYPQYEGDDEEEIDNEGEYEDEGMDEEDEEHLEEEEEEDEDDHYHVLEKRAKAKGFPRMEQLSSRIDISSTSRLDPPPRLVERIEPSPRQSPRRFESPSPRRFDTPSPRLDLKPSNARTPDQTTSSRPRLPDSVTICEPNSKRKLPLSLKDIRTPRVTTPQTSIEKVKKMRVE